MAAPVVSNYNVGVGQAIHAGRWPGGRLTGAIALSAAIAAGTLAPNASALAGNVQLEGALAGGTLTGRVLPAYLAGAAPHEWVIAAAAPSASPGVLPAVPGDMGGQANLVNAWGDGAVFNGKLYHNGGGHADYGGNEWLSVDTLVDAPQWDVEIERSPVGVLEGNVNYYHDGLPTSRHTYYSLWSVVIEGVPKLVRINAWSGFAYNGIPGGGGETDVRTTLIDAYNLVTREWEPGAYGPVINTFGSETSMAQDATTGDIYGWQGNTNRIERWSPSTNTSELVADMAGTEGNGGAIAFDHVNQRLVRFGGRSGATCVYWQVGGGNTKHAPTLIGPDAAEISALAGNNHGWGIAHVVRNNVVYLLNNAAELIRVRLNDWYVEKIATTGESPDAPVNSCWGRLFYIPELDAIGYLASWTSPLLVMRCE